VQLNLMPETTDSSYPVYSHGFWRAYVIHLRPYLMFISGIAGLTGMALTENTDPVGIWHILVFGAFFFSYGLGQALTDCFQMDTDRLSSPYRPLSKGLVTPRAVGIVSLLGLLAVGGILIRANIWNLPLVLFSIVGLTTYSGVKRYWFSGPFYNAWIVMLLPIMGYLSLSDVGLPDLLDQPIVFYSVLGLSFFSYANFVLMGYLKDITADRQTGYRTFPVVFGWSATVWVGDIFAAAAIGFAGYSLFLAGGSLAAYLAGSLIAVAGQVSAHTVRDKTEVNAAFAIAATVRAFILLHISVLLGYWEEAVIPAFLFYMAFEFALWKRPESSQI